MNGFDRITIVGAGAWGTALANALTRAGRAVTLCPRDPAAIAVLQTERRSPRLPEVRIEGQVGIGDVSDVAAGCDVVLLAVPAQALRAAATAVGPTLARGVPVVSCAKGIERATRRFMTDVLRESLPDAVPAILSGPSFAIDVARGLPTAVTLAAVDEELAAALAGALGSSALRIYHSTDVRGVEIGGAAKNVLAIAAGIAAGRKLGASAVAALTTRGFAELTRFGRAFGARPETLTGLSGLGDLILTCSTPQSRNFSLGVALGEGRPAPETLATTKLAEGAYTASALVAMANERSIDMPIATAVAAVLDAKLSVGEAIESLLTRPFRAEA